MYRNKRISVVIPARDEQSAIGLVVSELRHLIDNGEPIIDEIIVCDNGSTDNTANEAASLGAKVVYQGQPGYGIACLTALTALSPECDIVLFIDGDHAFTTTQSLRLIDQIINGADLSIGSRVLGTQQAGALTLPQRFGNGLASVMIRVLLGAKVTDLGPFRAMRRKALDTIAMQDESFGWTVEMQIKAIQHQLVTQEVAVDTRCRIGESKISGTIKGTIGAGVGIISTILKLWWKGRNLHKHPIENRL